MKISIERGTLLKAVGQAQSVVERRNTIPILANVLIEAEGNSVSFRATDLDIEVIDLPHEERPWNPEDDEDLFGTDAEEEG